MQLLSVGNGFSKPCPQERPQLRVEIVDDHTELFLALSLLPAAWGCNESMSHAISRFPKSQHAYVHNIS